MFLGSVITCAMLPLCFIHINTIITKLTPNDCLAIVISTGSQLHILQHIYDLIRFWSNTIESWTAFLFSKSARTWNQAENNITNE